MNEDYLHEVVKRKHDVGQTALLFEQNFTLCVNAYVKKETNDLLLIHLVILSIVFL